MGGVISTSTPHDYVGEFFASDTEMMLHGMDVNTTGPMSKEGQEWMSQWSPEEELIAEHRAGFEALLEHGGVAMKFMSIVSFATVSAMVLWISLAKKVSSDKVNHHWV